MYILRIGHGLFQSHLLKILVRSSVICLLYLNVTLFNDKSIFVIKYSKSYLVFRIFLYKREFYKIVDFNRKKNDLYC